ncbi:ankyrin repeat-containing domain protein [Mycena haematopus]|nr:ankyrin repeat-containing domain protein [Mycena haematopus]
MHAKLQILVDEQTRNKLDKWLKPPMRVDKSLRSAANARHANTGLWFLERPEFREWIYAPGSFLWLHGISGSGKTILSSTIIDTIHDRAENYVFFYFDTNNSEQQTVTQLLCSLVTQLSVQSQFPDSKLDTLWTSHNSGRKLLTDAELISEALLPLLKEYDQKPLFMVLDALDECSECPSLLRLISRMLNAKLANVHILVTSRPEVQSGCPELAALAMSVSLGGCVDGDIELYLTELLSNEGGWMSNKRDEIKRRLLEHSNGMFRLVALQLDELRNCDGTKSQVEKALKNMPASLNTIYDRILENIRNPGMLARVCRAMNWLIFSKRPMALSEIIDALAFDFEHEPLLFDMEERMGTNVLRLACAGFISVSQDEEQTIKLAHSSVKEYFLSATQPRPSGDCEVSEQAAHYLLSRTCIAYLCSFDHVLDPHSELQQYPLALYAAENWAFHLKLCDNIGLGTFSITEKAQNVDVLKVPNHTGELVNAAMQLIQLESTHCTTLVLLWNCRSLGFMDKWQWARVETASALPPLYIAASLGIGQIVWKLLESGADVNTQGGEYGNALQAASYGKHIEIVCLLLESGADVNAQGGYFGNALQAASRWGHIKIVCLLLESGANVNVQGGVYGNALQATSLEGSIEIVRLLLESGADVNAQGGYLGNALQAASYGNHIEIVCLLLESGADVNMQGGYFGNALQAACYREHIEIVNLLLESGADVNVQGGYFGNALQAASRWGHIKIVCLLLESGANVNVQGGVYGNALQAASYWEHIEIVRLLLESGADVNVQGGEYGNALQAASYWEHIEIVRLLLESGADVNMQGGEYGNALQAASYLGNSEIVHLLLEHSADVNVQGGEYGNALQAASFRGNTETVFLLLKSGADVNTQGREYGNALQAASGGGSIEIVRLLLESGAHVNVQGGEYGNALQAASYWEHIEIVRLLLESGADVNAQGGEYGNALQAGSCRRNIGIVRLLLESGADVNAQGGYFGNALQAASYWGHIKAVRLLLESGADGNVQRRVYGNALQVASLKGSIEIVRLLLESGADVNMQGGEYGNALQAASYLGNREIVHLLLEHSADVNVQGGEYGNALQAASCRGSIEIVRLLLESGADVNLQGGEYGNALQAASYQGHIKIVCLLLESGADVNAQGGGIRQRTPRRIF